MKRWLVILAPALLAAATLMPGVAGAEVIEGNTYYYVNPEAACTKEKTTCNGETPAKAWPTVKEAAEKVKPGPSTESDFVLIHEGTYKEGGILFPNGLAGKATLVFENELVGGSSLIEGELKLAASNQYFFNLNVKGKASEGPCLVVTKRGLTGLNYIASLLGFNGYLGTCKSEPLANWFGDEVTEFHMESRYDEAGTLKMRPDGAHGTFSEPERQNSKWWNEHIAMIMAGYCAEVCWPRQFQVFEGTELREPVIMYEDYPKYEAYAPLTPAKRTTFVKEAVEEQAQATRTGNSMTGHPYAGMFLDDINWRCAYRDELQEHGEKRECTEPAGNEGELKEERELVKGVRAQLKAGAVIEINSHPGDVWPLLKANTETSGKCTVTEEWKKQCELVEAALKEVTQVDSEFGLRASSVEEAKEYFAYWDALHALKLHTTITGAEGTQTTQNREYSLATYFLINDGNDFITELGLTQGEIFGGIDDALKEPLGAQTEARKVNATTNVYERGFTHAKIYLNPTGNNKEQTIPAGCKKSVEWGEASFALKPGHAAVCHV